MKQHTNKSKLRLVCQVALTSLLLSHQAVSAATIVWQAPQRISGDSDVRNQGNLVGAYSFCASSYSAPTINGVTFTPAVANTTMGIMQSAGASYGYDVFYGTAAPYTALNSSYRQILSRGAYKMSGAGTMSLTLTLTAGQTYMVQMWVNDSRGNSPSNQRAAVFTTTGAAPFDYPSAKVDAMQTAQVNGQVGQYIIGYLTMGPSESTVTLNVNPSPSGSTQVNAIQVREAGEQTAWMADAKYGIMLHYQIGGILGPHTDSGPPIRARQAQVYQVGGNKTQSDWSATVNSFDIQGFSEDAAAAGAGWVIISVGSKYGYYSSHNSTYEAKGSVSGGANLIKGEFTPKPGMGTAVDGDLILNLGKALKAKGIALIVYMASEGPWEASTLTKSDGTTVEMKVNTFAGCIPSDWAPGAHPNFQTLIRDMITEWSTRWGSNVAGWWFDGTFSGTGYGATGLAPGGGTVGAVTALANLNGLVTAAKSGNPGSLVALNPGYNNFAALSDTQDYLAGEWAIGGPAAVPSPAVYADSPNGKFAYYPTSQTVTMGTKNVQWHTLSFLGDSWRKPRKAYSTEELTSYISTVSSVGGAVTLDVYYTKEGRIPKVFLDQLKAVKATLKPNAVPAATPAAPVANFANLALFKPAYLKANSPGNISSPELQPLGEGTYRANGGNDGNYRTYAEANYPTTGIYDYSYIVDLGSSQSIDRIVFYPDGHYSTSYQIYYSTDGSTWQHFNTVTTTYSASNFDIKVHNADSVKTARYVKIKSLLPNTGGAYSVTMSVNELEVYYTGGVMAGADTVWMDDHIAGAAMPGKSASLVTLTGTWDWFNVMALTYDPVNPGINPQPRDGVRYHVSGSGINEHGFTDTPATLKVGNNDSLYCWVWVAEATPEILLRWKATDGTEGRARWGDTDDIDPGAYRAGAVPTANAAPLNDMPAVTLPNGSPGDSGQWVRLSVSASNVGLAGKTLKGMGFAANGGNVFFDRIGKMTPP